MKKILCSIVFLLPLLLILSCSDSGGNSSDDGSVAENSTVETIADIDGKPDGVTVSEDGSIYITEVDDGEITSIDESEENSTESVYSPSEEGTETITLTHPDGIDSISENGENILYIADTGMEDGVTALEGQEGGIYTYSESGGLEQIDTGGEIANPAGVAVNSDGDLFVTDQGNGEVYMVIPDEQGSTASVSSILNGFDSIEEPHGIAIQENEDGTQTIYVTDMGESSNNVIEITIPADGDPAGAEAQDLTPDSSGGSTGDSIDTALFDQPHGVAVNGNGVVFVTDENNNRVQVITPSGNVVTLAGGQGEERSETGDTASFNSPRGICVSSEGIVYVCDYGNRKVKKITPSFEK